MTRIRRKAGVALLASGALAAPGFGARAATASASAPACTIGLPIEERVVLEPRNETFYSVDVLNPDLVRYKGRYLLFFSGNDQHTEGGHWHTGVALSDSPLGPFRVAPRVKARFYNGGTTVADGRLYQAASIPEDHNPRLYTSTDARRWREIARMPGGSEGSWRAWQSDMHLQPGLEAYWAGRAGPGGADIGISRYQRGRWTGFERAVRRGPAGSWDHMDLGEPAVFAVKRRTFMLYGGLGSSGQARQIGLAAKTSQGWKKCGLAIAAGRRWYRQNAIDPEPLVAGDRLYVYFGGGQRPSLGADMDGRIGVRVYDLTGVG
jgi:predicted GH43/DUF377 family glycosyl hydrolase